jgi:hypothetical protein
LRPFLKDVERSGRRGSRRRRRRRRRDARMEGWREARCKMGEPDCGGGCGHCDMWGVILRLKQIL